MEVELGRRPKVSGHLGERGSGVHLPVRAPGVEVEGLEGFLERHLPFLLNSAEGLEDLPGICLGLGAGTQVLEERRLLLCIL